MSLLDRIKERAAPDLSDAEVTAMIAAITAEIDAHHGPVGPVTVELGDVTDPETPFRLTLHPVPPIKSGEPVAIVERDPGNSGDAGAAITLAAGDYRVLHNGRTLQRLTSGPNGRAYWAPLVTLTYTPDGPSQAERDEAIIKLMILDLGYRGAISSERAGDWQVSFGGNPNEQRDAIISGLAQSGGMMMA